MAEQTLAPFNMINLGQRANMQLPNIGSIVDTSPDQLDASGMAALETGEVIIALHLNEDTLDILQFWVRHYRIPEISIAPLSVVLLAS